MNEALVNCPACGHGLAPSSRFCTNCGTTVADPFYVPSSMTGRRPEAEEMHLPTLYAMVALLIVAGLFPPWETPPGQTPAFLGFHFVLAGAAQTGGVVSRLLLTIELVTIAVAGLYGSWLLRKRPHGR
ncbi:MAG: zinc ribbon domain-containing protein [Nitrospiraceae bacterium]